MTEHKTPLQAPEGTDMLQIKVSLRFTELDEWEKTKMSQFGSILAKTKPNVILCHNHANNLLKLATFINSASTSASLFHLQTSAYSKR